VEKDLYAGHPAVIYSIGQVLPIIVAIAAAAVAIIAGAPAAYVVLGFVLLVAIICLRYYLKSASTHYQITSQRIKLERGLLSKLQESLELFRIDHFELRKPLGMRLVGQGSLHLFSSDAELENFYIYGVPNLEALADTLRTCQLRERSRRGLTTFVKA
jgi:membrane protein YdbS with pleckstrin-like domain